MGFSAAVLARALSDRCPSSRLGPSPLLPSAFGDILMSDSGRFDMKIRWETREVQCPEGEHTASLLIAWHDDDGEPRIKNISCDNPRLADFDNWDCKWTCWEKISRRNEI